MASELIPDYLWRNTMDDPRRNDPVGPTLSWHFLNATACAGLWFITFGSSIAVLVAVSPQGLRQSKVMGLVPLFLMLVFNFGFMLLASMRASRRTREQRAAPEA